MLSEAFMNEMFQFFGASSQCMFELQDGARPDETTPIQYKIIEYLYFKEMSGASTQSTLSDISACMYLSMPNASREVKKLMSKGFLDKSTDDNDRRIQRIYLSKSGKELMDISVSMTFEKANQRYKSLTTEQQQAMISHMEILRKTLFTIAKD